MDAFSKSQENYNADPPSGTLLDHDWPGNKVLQSLSIWLSLYSSFSRLYIFTLVTPIEEILCIQRMGQLEQTEKTYLPV